MGPIGETKERWQIEALLETLGELRARLAHAVSEHDRELAELRQKLEAAKDALAKLEQNEGFYGRQLAKGYDEIECLKSEVTRIARERDDARALLESAWLGKEETK